MKKYLVFLKPYSKKFFPIILILLILFSVVFLFNKYVFKIGAGKVYEALVVMKDETAYNPKGASDNTFKKGDVFLLKEEGHDWSQTEKVSYLILKLRLSEEEAKKLTVAIERPPTELEVRNEMKKYERGDDKTRAEELKRLENDFRQKKIIVRKRQFRIKIEEFIDLYPNVLLKGQPYLEKVYDWGMVAEADISNLYKNK